MSRAILLGLILSYSALAETKFTLSESIYRGENVPLLKHSGPGQWDNYLTMNLPFEPIAELFAQLLIDQRKQLSNRGEAHITVVTPVEYWNSLKPAGVSIEEIQKIAANKKIQQAQFDVVCLGQGEARLNEKTEQTFYVVVKSDDLMELRREIRSLFLAKGGNAVDFMAENFHPHITLGFTSRDLHESDGVIKNADSCQSLVQIK